jgi:hypothetical protein
LTLQTTNSKEGDAPALEEASSSQSERAREPEVDYIP